MDVPFSDFFVALIEIDCWESKSTIAPVFRVLLAFRVVLVIVPVGDFDFGYGY